MSVSLCATDQDDVVCPFRDYGFSTTFHNALWDALSRFSFEHFNHHLTFRQLYKMAT